MDSSAADLNHCISPRQKVINFHALWPCAKLLNKVQRRGMASGPLADRHGLLHIEVPFLVLQCKLFAELE